MEDFILAFQSSAQKIQNLLKVSHTDYLSTTNSSGDNQLGIDVKADKIIEEELLSLNSVRGLCSEEKNEVIYKDYGSYFIAYDPLDGSSIISSNLSVGSIFGIYKEGFESKNIIAAAYVVYGPRLELVFANDVLSYFIYDGKSWKKQPPLKLNESGKINAPGGTQKNWSSKHKTLIDSFFQKGYRLRYSGGMVPDLHQILIKKGGLFSYPATSDAPNGKLRKLFEVFPFAFIYEKAGGGAIDGKNRLLELPINGIHDTSPCFFGSIEEINEVRRIYE
ncbi:class 1 fructose-bisphosphatase [Helicobacter sp. faydin-H76]|uniref:Fructose-1,6-bisphosphatase class 1 n=2 Tax=Helicobacter cappadocius TaxID=3063998 RepID=A0AA90PRY3_9HELI|nr:MULTISPECIES: class 1 fructose-bisphosphatase [unclassified Helicobacter]MDO7252497.1 class 1 fructose-bisphosphatase [Helicobacter sp. faydin-H75]MDP2538364.1 class 1 fructose-bisphosphatase [Helicobacter sp. faydin-H76]